MGRFQRANLRVRKALRNLENACQSESNLPLFRSPIRYSGGNEGKSDINLRRTHFRREHAAIRIEFEDREKTNERFFVAFFFFFFFLPYNTYLGPLKMNNPYRGSAMIRFCIRLRRISLT